MGKTIQKALFALLIISLMISVLFAATVKAEDTISDYENVSAEQVVNDINNTSIDEGEMRYDRNYTIYRLTVYPKTVIIGQSVTVVAETDNPRVTHVTFVWVKSFGGIKKIETVNVYSEDGWKKANSTYTPDELGSWLVFALFMRKTNTGSCCMCRCGWLYAMRWTCFKVKRIPQQIPDFPVVGTGGATAVMLVGLGLFLNKKRQKSI
ncbi:MAG: hypothetical protein QW270_04675 [Candidatus Bathyarchaeia archaeon]